MPEPIFIAIDPGNTYTAWVVARKDSSFVGGLRLIEYGIAKNISIQGRLLTSDQRTLGSNNGFWLVGEQYVQLKHMVIETPKPRGQPTSAHEMETFIETGRFIEAWLRYSRGLWSMAFRIDVKMHLCGRAASKDANVRQALIDRFGGKDHAIGKEKCHGCRGRGRRARPKRLANEIPAPMRVVTCVDCDGSGWLYPPGPLASVSTDIWSALAVACWWVDNADPVYPQQHITVKPPRERPTKTCSGTDIYNEHWLKVLTGPDGTK